MEAKLSASAMQMGLPLGPQIALLGAQHPGDQGADNGDADMEDIDGWVAWHCCKTRARHEQISLSFPQG